MIRKLIYFIMIGMLVVSCYPSNGFELGSPFDLKYHETKTNSDENLRIRFDGVVTDERCPIEYNCFVPGNAQVQLTLRKNFQSETIVLNTYDHPTVQIALGYQIEVTTLQPPNSANNPPSQGDYVVTLLVYPPHPNGECDSNSDCAKGEYCDWCGTSSCPMCDDCVPACRPL